MREDSRVDEYIGQQPDWQQAVCLQVRQLVHAADPEVEETPPGGFPDPQRFHSGARFVRAALGRGPVYLPQRRAAQDVPGRMPWRAGTTRVTQPPLSANHRRSHD